MFDGRHHLMRDAHAAPGSVGGVIYLSGIGPAQPSLPAADEAKKALLALRQKYGLPAQKQRAEAEVRKQGLDILKKSGAAAADKYLKGAGKQYVYDLSQKLGADAAKSYGQEVLKGMNIPGLPAGMPLKLPSKLTVDAVERAAFDTGKAYAENLIKSKIGVPIELPSKLTVKELSRTVDSLIPNDAAEALDLAATVGTQVAASAAASALTGVLAATAIGSAVPGLGTLVGLGVGLATVALKGVIKSAFTESDCERDKRMCKCKTPAGFKRPDPGKRSAVELLPWLADEQHKLSKIKLEPKLCGIGEVPEAMSYLGTLTTIVAPYVASALPSMSLPALERLLPSYERAATYARTGPGYSHQGDPGGIIKYGTPAHANSLGFVTPAMPAPLQVIKSRIAFLKGLAASVQSISKTGDLSSLRWNLATELNAAMGQYSLNQSTDNEQWFTLLGTAFGKLEDEEERRRLEMVKSQKQGEALADARLSSDVGPLWKAHDDRENWMFQCDEAGGRDSVPNHPACLALKAAEKQIIDLHRQGMKLPVQPKGSGPAWFEDVAEREAKRLGPLPSATKPASSTTAPSYSDYLTKLKDAIDLHETHTYSDYERMLMAAASGLEAPMKIEIGYHGGGGHHGGGHHGGHHGGGHHHHHGHHGGGGYGAAPWLGPAYDWPFEQPVVYVLDPTQAAPQAAPEPTEEAPPAQVPDDVAAVSGLAARYAGSAAYQEALRVARGVLRGGKAQLAAVAQVIARAHAGDAAAQRFLRYWPLAVKHAKFEAQGRLKKGLQPALAAVSGCIDGPPGTRAMSTAAAGLGYPSHDLLAAGRAAMQQRHLHLGVR